MPRIPKDPDNITPHHIDLLIADAWKKFDRYEAKVDFNWPKERIDALYRPYQLAVEQCQMYKEYGTASQRRLINRFP